MCSVLQPAVHRDSEWPAHAARLAPRRSAQGARARAGDALLIDLTETDRQFDESISTLINKPNDPASKRSCFLFLHLHFLYSSRTSAHTVLLLILACRSPYEYMRVLFIYECTVYSTHSRYTRTSSRVHIVCCVVCKTMYSYSTKYRTSHCHLESP